MRKAKTYTIVKTKYGMSGTRTYEQTGTVEELKKAYSYTLEVGQSYASEKGNKKVNTNPKGIKTLIKALNTAANNTGNGEYYELKEENAN